jgi:hypothetical protein
MEQLTYVVEYEYGAAGADKKKAVISLAAELLREVTHLRNDQFLPTLDALGTSANEKHVQLSFTDAVAQAAIVDIGWSGAVAPPADTTDVLVVSNGVIKSSKANLGVSKTLGYQVALQADGAAATTLTLGYKKSSLKLLAVPRQWMGDYVRVHRGPGTTRVAGKGTTFETLDDATGLPTFGHYFRLDRGASTSLVLHSQVPQALRSGVATALPGMPATAGRASQELWHYRLLLAKQADLVDTDASITVQVPQGWKVAGSTARFRVSGAPIATSGGPTEVVVSTPLMQDVILDVTLTRG